MSWAEFMGKSPAEVTWQHGPLPPVETVPHDCVLVLWAPHYVGLVIPWGNDLNWLRWCDHSLFPLREPHVGWWTVARAGSEPRPANVQTEAEYWSTRS